MFSLSTIPIRRKLMIISLLTSGTALLLACAAFVTYEQLNFRKSMTRDLSITARMIGFNSTAALSFNDPQFAEQTLQALNAQPHIVAACVYDAGGEVFATYSRNDVERYTWPSARPESESFTGEALDLFRKIEHNGETLGTIYLQSDLGQIRERWERYALIVGAVLLVAILFAWALAARLQRFISGPVSHLASVAGKVASEKDYSLRAVKQSEDEMGRLTDSFNEMLTQIQTRDNALNQARDELERRVEKRTAQLKREMDERNRVAEELQRSKDYVDSIIKSMANTLLVVDSDNRITYANRSALDLLGYEKKELLGRPLSDVINGGTQTLLKELPKEGVITDQEVSYRTRDGSSVPMAFSASTLGSDARPGLVCVAQDISLRKKTEEDLREMHQQLLRSSRQAGMAEVATSVLHNVGNVLNSANISTTLLKDRMRKSKGANLDKVSALLQEHKTDLAAFLSNDTQGQKIPNYIITLAEHLSEERRGIIDELESLRKNIDHIKDIVSMQQNYAKVSGIKETVPLVDLAEDALRMNAGAFQRHSVEVVRDYRERPSVTIERHKVLQILVNLLRNAKYACDEVTTADSAITVRIAETEESVEIAVSDNGVGIPRENLSKIFGHGFTTRKEGHGFGLHSSALAAKEIGASLNVHSDGPGKGATFVLEIPLKAKEMTAA